MKAYDHRKIEKKWQKAWSKKGIYETKERAGGKKFYILDMFPYPSGEGLHVGHPKGYIATDIISRMKRMQGNSVLHPMGFDAFGLPAENYAIKTKTNPAVSVGKNVDRYKKQLEILGFDYDWSREVNTTDPNYYRWTQWIFLKLFEKGLAYESYEPINWCPSCKTGLANEDVDDGRCERCGTLVEKKPLRQWVLRITDYADRLLSDLEKKDAAGKIILDWPQSIVELQKNWIGRSEGALIQFALNSESTQEKVEVFTTRPDTLFGVSYIVLAPEHPLVKKLGEKAENKTAILDYVAETAKQEHAERTNAGREVTGIEIKGISAVNPATGKSVPVWIADYVLADYGTGAVMGVPAHDLRDWNFAKKYQLPIIDAVIPVEGEKHAGSEFRKTISAIVRRPSDGKFLGLKWKKFGWTATPVGGIEGDESPEVAAVREVHEETGYKTRSLGLLGGVIESHFFAENKNIWRERLDQPVLLELVDENPDPVSEEEKGRHEIVWLTGKELLAQMTHRYNGLGLERYLANNHAYIEPGKLINSGKFDGLASEKARKVITEAVGGKWVTKYKLRDWVFSRQRYWGEPMPIIHCQSCAFEQYRPQAKLSLSFYVQSVWSALASGEKKIETRALNPEEKERYFGDIKVGDIIHCVNKKKPAELLFRVKSVKIYRNFEELFAAKDIHSDIRKKEFSSVKEMEAWYESFNPGYAEKIKKNGLIAWGFEAVTKAVPVPEKDLPVKLPKVTHYEPTGTGESPLAAISKWVNTKCPECGKPAKRETNTMPQWAGSSWYYLRYMDPKNTKALVSKERENFWAPVDLYVGGAEHATRHLIYARFWHKFLYDIGVVSTEEPFKKLQHVGLIMAEDGRKMSKRWGNVVNPDEIIELYGADTLRMYEMFMGPFDQSVAWSTKNMIGTRRFIERVWRLGERVSKNTSYEDSAKIQSMLHKTIKKVGDDIENIRLNTAVSSLMILLNEIETAQEVSHQTYQTLIQLIAPFAPHISEELWTTILGEKTSVHVSSWPIFDPKKAQDSVIKIALQVNGKTRAETEIPPEIDQATLEKLTLDNPEIIKWIVGKEVKKIIVVKGRLVNIVAV